MYSARYLLRIRNRLEDNVRTPKGLRSTSVEGDAAAESDQSESEREWSEYELAVIGYYNRYGYVEVAADQAIIEDYVDSSRQQGSEPSPAHTSVDDPRWQEDAYTYVSPYYIGIGLWTDETVPQIVRFI